ncbi:MAG: BrnT family toxin [Melioribacteraceae bacterium]
MQIIKLYFILFYNYNIIVKTIQIIFVFYDENARVILDAEHSVNEDRFIIIGISNKLKLLIVVHTYRENDEVIRIISARKATKSESKYYKEIN